MSLHDERTSVLLEDARAQLHEQSEEGTTCPCCDQYAKVYKRRLSANMVLFLIDLVTKCSADGWMKYTECRFTGRDYNFLRHWGLADTRVNNDPEKKSSGMWRPTQLGRDFLSGRAFVPAYVHVYNNIVVETDKNMVGPQEALGKRFSFSELMGRAEDD